MWPGQGKLDCHSSLAYADLALIPGGSSFRLRLRWTKSWRFCRRRCRKWGHSPSPDCPHSLSLRCLPASMTVTIWDIASEEAQPNIWFGRLCLITTVVPRLPTPCSWLLYTLQWVPTAQKSSLQHWWKGSQMADVPCLVWGRVHWWGISWGGKMLLFSLSRQMVWRTWQACFTSFFFLSNLVSEILGKEKVIAFQGDYRGRVPMMLTLLSLA